MSQAGNMNSNLRNYPLFEQRRQPNYAHHAAHAHSQSPALQTFPTQHSQHPQHAQHNQLHHHQHVHPSNTHAASLPSPPAVRKPRHHVPPQLNNNRAQSTQHRLSPPSLRSMQSAPGDYQQTTYSNNSRQHYAPPYYNTTTHSPPPIASNPYQHPAQQPQHYMQYHSSPPARPQTQPQTRPQTRPQTLPNAHKVAKPTQRLHPPSYTRSSGGSKSATFLSQSPPISPETTPTHPSLPAEHATASGYIKYLIKQVRELTEERNKMQQTICTLQKQLRGSHLLEEDFYSLIARIEFPAWISQEQKTLCLNQLCENERSKRKEQLAEAKLTRRKAAQDNLSLETKVIAMSDAIGELRENLEQAKHANYLASVSFNKNLAVKLLEKKKERRKREEEEKQKSVCREYPPENVVIQNLIRTQIEFYFSDYNLKRDKRLLDQLCSDRVGFLKIDTVMNLTRVRQLSSHRNQVVNALKHSKFLSLTPDHEWVGRSNFERPTEKQFPFRRTVFIFGLPLTCSEKYVTEMLSPFGKLSKIKFDHGPDTLDRLVAEHMFKEPKVYTYRDLGQHVTFHYRQESMVGGSPDYTCHKCSKLKTCDEGFYETRSYELLICLQCAASGAEDILDKCKTSAGGNERMIQLLCGKAPRNVSQTRTALAVFTSQRQASKCVYVRARIGYDGCFATHYHHYSKLKKEIALTLQPHADKLREIPPRRVLHEVAELNRTRALMDAATVTNVIRKAGSLKTMDDDNVYHLSTLKGVLAPPTLHHEMSEDIDDQDGMFDAEYYEDEDDAGSELDILHATHCHTTDVYNTGVEKRLVEFAGPKLEKQAAGSMTAPVVGGKGVYLMRAAYEQLSGNLYDTVGSAAGISAGREVGLVGRKGESLADESFADDTKKRGC